MGYYYKVTACFANTNEQSLCCPDLQVLQRVNQVTSAAVSVLANWLLQQNSTIYLPPAMEKRKRVTV